MNRLSKKGILAYSMGQLAAGTFFAFNNFTLPIYLSVYTNNAILIGWLSSTRSFEQSIIQPVVGAWSDRTWTPIGRRSPFFLTAMPLAALIMIANGLLPHAPNFLPIVVLAVFSFSLLFNFGIDPYYALLADVTASNERGSVNGFATFLQFVGQVGILVVAAKLYEIHPALVFSLVAAMLLVGFLLVKLGVREPRQLSQGDAPASLRISRQQVRSLFVYVRHLFGEQPEAMKLLGVKCVYEFGINAALPFLTLFMVTEIGTNGWSDVIAAVPLLSGLSNIDATSLSQLVAAFLLLMTMLFAIPCGLLGDRVGKKSVFIVGLVVLGIFALFAAFATRVPQMLLYLVFIGLGNAADTVLFFPYLTQLIPPERNGEFAGLSAFAETSGVFLSILVAGELLNRFNHQYRIVFILTGVFLILGGVLTLFVKGQLSQGELTAAPAG